MTIRNRDTVYQDGTRVPRGHCITPVLTVDSFRITRWGDGPWTDAELSAIKDTVQTKYKVTEIKIIIGATGLLKVESMQGVHALIIKALLPVGTSITHWHRRTVAKGPGR